MSIVRLSGERKVAVCAVVYSSMAGLLFIGGIISAIGISNEQIRRNKAKAETGIGAV